MKHALLLAFTYHKNIYGVSKITRLTGTCNDLKMMVIFCIQKGVPVQNITILTDLSELPKECENCNVKYNNYPESVFICRELAQFVENTVRGIEDSAEKSDSELPQILVYISGHGAMLKVETPEIREEQGLVILDNGGTEICYFTTKDIFNVIFGRIPMTSSGNISIPIYIKNISLIPVEKNGAKSYKEHISTELKFVDVALSPVCQSPSNSPGMTVRRHRSTYNSNRGIPPWSQVLFIIDACHSAHMVHFPYIYCPKDQVMKSFKLENVFVDHEDMPYCVSISSCEMENKTKSAREGSYLTQAIFTTLMTITVPLNVIQFFYYVVNSKPPRIPYPSQRRSKYLFPVLSSTSNNVDSQVPFFSENSLIVRPKKVIK